MVALKFAERSFPFTVPRDVNLSVTKSLSSKLSFGPKILLSPS